MNPLILFFGAAQFGLGFFFCWLWEDTKRCNAERAAWDRGDWSSVEGPS